MRLHCLSTPSLQRSPSGSKLTTLARTPAYYAQNPPRHGSRPSGSPCKPVPVYVTRLRSVTR